MSKIAQISFSGYLTLMVLSCADGQFAGQSASGDAPAHSDTASGDAQRQKVIDDLEERGIVDADTLEQACDQSKESELKQIETKLLYPERKDCRFDQEPNLERRDAFIQAYESTDQTISLPNNGIICEMQIASQPQARLHYDDFLFFTIEDQVIFGSNNRVANYLPRKEGVFQWDFESMKGQPIGNFESPYHCLGGTESCVLPPHDQAGPVDLSLRTADIAPISFLVAGKSDVSAKLIATGDNDDEDCFHTELDLTVVIDYLEVN